MLFVMTNVPIQPNLFAVTRTSLLRCGPVVRCHAKLAVMPVSQPNCFLVKEPSECLHSKALTDIQGVSNLYSTSLSGLHRLSPDHPPDSRSFDSCSSRVRESDLPVLCVPSPCHSAGAAATGRPRPGEDLGVGADDPPSSGGQTLTPTPTAVTCLSVPAALNSSGRTQLISHYLQIACSLSKARLTGLVVSSAVAGTLLGGSTSLASPVFLLHPVRSLVCLALGTALTSAAANTVNQILEIPHDSQMMRTQNRPLVRGLTSPGRAGLFALGCFTTGMSVLYLGTNSLVAGLALGNSLLYTTVYTPLKQVDQANTWIGALVGAVPPLMGWAAATGELQSGALFLACLLYAWQFPHFMSLSWNLRSQYSRAGYAMTCLVEPEVCRRAALKYAIASGLVCLAGAGCSAISLGPWAGCALGLSCLPPNIGLVYYAWQFNRSSEGGSDAGGANSSSSMAARRLFRASLLHLPVVMIVALIGSFYCGAAVPEYAV